MTRQADNICISYRCAILSLWTYLLSVHIEGQFGQCWVNSVCVCVCVCVGGGGGGGGGRKGERKVKENQQNK